MLLDEQRGKPLNFNFVGLYWQQVGLSPVPSDVALMGRCCKQSTLFI
jgi:hypothetical protein